VAVYFKSTVHVNGDSAWTSYAKRVGWATDPAHFLSEGGTQIIQSLTQWAEDRPPVDRKAVSKAVLAHLVAVAGAISPQSGPVAPLPSRPPPPPPDSPPGPPQW
jgi:hypothetical protein